jgi:hypothetical protein
MVVSRDTRFAMRVGGGKCGEECKTGKMIRNFCCLD